MPIVHTPYQTALTCMIQRHVFRHDPDCWPSMTNVSCPTSSLLLNLICICFEPDLYLFWLLCCCSRAGLAGHATAYQAKPHIYKPSNNPSSSLSSSARPVVYSQLWEVGGTCLILALVRPGPAQPDLVLPEVGRNVANHPLHADALPGAVLSCHLAGQLWLQNQAQLLGQVAGQASCQCLTPSPHLRNMPVSERRHCRSAMSMA